MPRNIIESELNENYKIFSLSTDLPDYKLCYSLNHYLKWDFRRISHLQLSNDYDNLPGQFSLFHYEYDQFANFFLLYPISEQLILLPNCFFILCGSIHLHTEQNILGIINNINGVYSVNYIELPSGVSPHIANYFDSLIYDLEYHLLELMRDSEGKILIRI